MGTSLEARVGIGSLHGLLWFRCVRPLPVSSWNQFKQRHDHLSTAACSSDKHHRPWIQAECKTEFTSLTESALSGDGMRPRHVTQNHQIHVGFISMKWCQRIIRESVVYCRLQLLPLSLRGFSTVSRRLEKNASQPKDGRILQLCNTTRSQLLLWLSSTFSSQRCTEPSCHRAFQTFR